MEQVRPDVPTRIAAPEPLLIAETEEEAPKPKKRSRKKQPEPEAVAVAVETVEPDFVPVAVETVEPELSPSFPDRAAIEEELHPPIAPLFEPKPFPLQLRPKFGRKAG